MPPPGPVLPTAHTPPAAQVTATVVAGAIVVTVGATVDVVEDAAVKREITLVTVFAG